MNPTINHIDQTTALDPAMISHLYASPWGAAQTISVHADGIYQVTTAGHGGIYVTPEWNGKIHPALRNEDGWYEEDCEWAIVCLYYPEEVSNGITGGQGTAEENGMVVKAAEKTVKEYYPYKYEEAFQTKVSPAESHVVRKDQMRRDNPDKLEVFSAFGSWHENVPAGYVGVVAGPYGRRGPERWFLVEKTKYKIGYLVDPAIDKEVGENFIS